MSVVATSERQFLPEAYGFTHGWALLLHVTATVSVVIVIN